MEIDSLSQAVADEKSTGNIIIWTLHSHPPLSDKQPVILYINNVISFYLLYFYVSRNRVNVCVCNESKYIL